MPWTAVDKEYRFEGPAGTVSLADLFEGRRQLIVYRAFYEPDVTTYPASGGSYPERACAGCSFVADQVAHPAHLNAGYVAGVRVAGTTGRDPRPAGAHGVEAHPLVHAHR